MGTINPISDTQRASYEVRKKRKKNTQPHRQGSKRKLDKMAKVECMVGSKIKKKPKVGATNLKFKQVQIFKCLGRVLTDDVKRDTEIRRLI